MRDRWDDEDDRLDRLSERGREPEPTLGETIDGAIRKVTTSLIIAGGLIALALFSRGGTRVEAPDYQITAADGRMYRLETDSGRVIACQGEHCWIMLRRGQDLDDDPPADEAPKQNAVAGQPAQAQLPAPQAAAPTPAQAAPPQNTAAPATR